MKCGSLNIFLKYQKKKEIDIKKKHDERHVRNFFLQNKI